MQESGAPGQVIEYQQGFGRDERGLGQPLQLLATLGQAFEESHDVIAGHPYQSAVERDTPELGLRFGGVGEHRPEGVQQLSVVGRLTAGFAIDC